MARDDFPLSVKIILAGRVGQRCSNPRCRKLTAGPRTDQTKAVNVGIAAHIAAASKKGPRYDPNMTPENRKSALNGIWLCSVCAKLIDNDIDRYPKEVLLEWKSSAEEEAAAEIEGATAKRAKPQLAKIEISDKALNRQQERHDYRLDVALENLGDSVIDSFHVDLEMPARVIENPEKIFPYVESRSDQGTAFFRVTSSKHHSGVSIYPGDKKIILTVDYFMDHDIYFRRGDLFSYPVRATLYLPGQYPIITNKLFKDLQDF